MKGRGGGGGVQIDSYPEKTTLKKPSLIRVKSQILPVKQIVEFPLAGSNLYQNIFGGKNEDDNEQQAICIFVNQQNT